MIKCTKCGADNLLNAVFCRTCGERLDLDSLRPEDFEDTGAKKKNDLANQIAGVILIVLAVVAVVGFLFPSCSKLTPNAPSANVTENLEKLTKKKPKGEAITFTSQEVTDLLNAKLKEYSGDLGSPAMTAISVDFVDSATMKVVISAKLGFLPLSITVSGAPQPSSFGISEDNVKIGFIPVPQDARADLLQNYRTVVNSILSGYTEYVANISTDVDKITITKR